MRDIQRILSKWRKSIALGARVYLIFRRRTWSLALRWHATDRDDFLLFYPG
jgi:hypothetical protein